MLKVQIFDLQIFFNVLNLKVLKWMLTIIRNDEKN